MNFIIRAVTHVRVLLTKNLLLQIRSPIWLAFEILLPILYVVFLLLGSANVEEITSGKEKALSLTPKQIIRAGIALERGCCSNPQEVTNWRRLISSQRNGSIYGINFIDFLSPDELRKNLTKNIDHIMANTQKRLSFGLIIRKFEPLVSKLEYKLLFEKEELTQTTNNMYGAAIQQLSINNNSKLGEKVFGWQYQIEAGFVKVRRSKSCLFFQFVTGKTTPNTTLMVLPRTERMRFHSMLTNLHFNLPLVLLLPALFMIRNLMAERNSILPYLSVMGVSKISFYLSHIFIGFIKFFLVGFIISVVAFIKVEDFPWLIYLIVLLMFCGSFAALCVLSTAVFKTPSTCTQVVTLIIILDSILTFTIPISYRISPIVATFLSLWPSKGLFFGLKYCFAVAQFSNKMGQFSSLVQVEWTHQLGLTILLMPLFTILLVTSFFLIKARIKSKRRIADESHLKYSDESSSSAKIPNANEEFEVDESLADLRLEKVQKVYPTGERAVKGISFTAVRGQVTALLGHNGAGKTTTFSMVCGVEKITAGQISICGYEAGTNDALNHIGYCSQSNTLIDKLTVKDHLWLAHNLKGASGSYWEEGQKLLETVGLQAFAKRPAAKLSGGQKRKLCLCMALIGNSRVILLDEPTAGMDAASRRDVEQLLMEVKKEKTILLTTHYMEEAETLGDRIFILAAGQIACSGSVQFGAGYTGTFVAEQVGGSFASSILNVIVQHVPTARLGEFRGTQLEVELPADDQSTFPALFKDLEERQKAIGCAHFGLSVNSLEAVFIKVSGIVATLREPEDEEEDKNKDIDELVQLHYSEETKSGFGLLAGQIGALYIKKLLYSRRFWGQLIIQLLIPIAFLCLSLISGTNNETNLNLANYGRNLEEFIFIRAALTTTPAAAGFATIVAAAKNGYLTSSLQPVEVVRKFYPEDVILGIEFEQNQEILLPNIEFRYSPLLAINMLNNARLSHLRGSIAAEMETYDEQILVSSIMNNMLLTFVVTFLVSQYAGNIIEDRVSQFASLQRLCGLSPITYWLAEVLYLFSFFAIQMIICTIPIAVQGFAIKYCLLVYLLMLLFYWAIIPSVLLISRIVRSGALASILLFVFHFFTGVIIIFLVATISIALEQEINLFETDVSKMNGVELINMVGKIVSPAASLIYAIISIIGLMHVNGSEKQHFLSPIKFHIILLFISGAVYLSAFLLSQLRVVKFCFHRLCRVPCLSYDVPPAEMIISEPSQAKKIVEVRDLTKIYGICGGKPGLSHLTMNVGEKECFGLLGTSGAGKTTAFTILTGQMFPTRGRAEIDGKSVSNRLTIGYCPQFDAIHPQFTGREALTLLTKIHGYRDSEKTVNQLLKLVDMNGKSHERKKMSQLSGGQRRRVSVAAALIPKQIGVIVLDEATAGIDPAARREIWRVLTSVKQQHSAILMSSHGMDECEALCDRIAILKEGGLVAIGTRQELISQYGNFYVLSLEMPTRKKQEQAINEVPKRLPGSVLKSDGFSLHLKWRIPKTAEMLWSQLFSVVVELAKELGAVDFRITQSSLEDIFLVFATNQQ